MYWPVGTPRIYAANTTIPQLSTGSNPHSRAFLSHDGASIGNNGNNANDDDDAGNRNANGNGNDNDDRDSDVNSINPNDPLLRRPDTSTTKSSESIEKDTSRLDFPITPGLRTPLTPAVNAVDHDRFQDAWGPSSQQVQQTAGIPTGEPILGLTVSRTGHLFAAITSTTLTVWQTKVCLPSTAPCAVPRPS